MDDLRLRELSYKAQQGVLLKMDQFEVSELIDTATKIGEIQNSQASVYDDIQSEAGSILGQCKDFKEWLETLKSTVEENESDFPDCFKNVFHAAINKLNGIRSTIENDASEIEICSQNAQSDLFGNSF